MKDQKVALEWGIIVVDPESISFNICINEMVPGTELTFSNYSLDTKVGGTAITPDGCAAIHTDLDSMENYTEGYLVKFNREKCQILCPGRKNPR